VPVVAHRRAASPDEALAAAAEVGWPAVLKTAEPGIDHKSDAGGVHLALGDADAVHDAYRDLAARLGPRVLVSRMAGPATELALGFARDPQFGPVLVIAAGGTLVELLRDRQVALPPVDVVRARQLVDRLGVRAVLAGVRGRAAADLDAVARAIAAVSTLAQDLGDHLDALDVNPLLAGPGGCVAVDALVLATPAARAPRA
jgi:acetate---CoA ligase (ADP-forming)